MCSQGMHDILDLVFKGLGRKVCLFFDGCGDVRALVRRNSTDLRLKLGACVRSLDVHILDVARGLEDVEEQWGAACT